MGRRRAQQSGVSVWWPALLRPTLTVQSVTSEAALGAADNPECLGGITLGSLSKKTGKRKIVFRDLQQDFVFWCHPPTPHR